MRSLRFLVHGAVCGGGWAAGPEDARCEPMSGLPRAWRQTHLCQGWGNLLRARSESKLTNAKKRLTRAGSQNITTTAFLPRSAQKGNTAEKYNAFSSGCVTWAKEVVSSYYIFPLPPLRAKNVVCCICHSGFSCCRRLLKEFFRDLTQHFSFLTFLKLDLMDS